MTGRVTVLVLAPLGLYCALVIATALRVAWTLRRLADAPLAGALVLTIHLCYGVGVLRGLVFGGGGRRGRAREGHWTSTAPRSREAVQSSIGEDSAWASQVEAVYLDNLAERTGRRSVRASTDS